MQILVRGIGEHHVNFWFDVPAHMPDMVYFQQRYNCGTGTALKSRQTGHRFFAKLEEHKLKQIL